MVAPPLVLSSIIPMMSSMIIMAASVVLVAMFLVFLLVNHFVIIRVSSIAT